MPINISNTFKIVCLFARECGVYALKELLNDNRVTIVALLVHSKLPKSEDSNRGIRPEFPIFEEIAHKYSIPLSAIDSREEAKNLALLKKIDSFDFLISLSWRFMIPMEIFSKARIAAINVHRGKLPTYAGSEPVKRALENSEKYVFLTVHEMVEEIDAGRVLLEQSHLVNFDYSKTLEMNVERIKKEILPLYPKVVIEAIDLILKGKEIKKDAHVSK